MAHWIWRFVGWTLTIAIGAGVSVWIYKKQTNKALTYRVVSISPLGPLQARGFADLRLFKGDNVIQRPFLLTLRMTNTGDVSIPPSDFSGPLTLRPVGLSAFKGGLVEDKGQSVSKFNVPWIEVAQPSARVVDARVAATTPPKIPVDLKVDTGLLHIQPLLLNAGDDFTVEMLISGDALGIEVAGRVAGIKQIVEEVPKDNSPGLERLSRVTIMVGAVAMLLGFLLALFAPASQTARMPPKVKNFIVSFMGFGTGMSLTVVLLQSRGGTLDFAIGLGFVSLMLVAIVAAVGAAYSEMRRLKGKPPE